MSLTEGKWSAKICEQLKKVQNLFLFRIVGNFRQASGLPDCCLIHKGRVIFIEFKGESTEIRPLQIAVMKQMRAAGSNVFVVRQPYSICTIDGEVLKFYDGTVFDLLKCLHFICDGDARHEE